MNKLTSMLRSRNKYQKINKNAGFTLIELLVGLVMATLVITPLLGFMLNILNTDRREQAKANTEKEIKAALEYIERDLKQSVYIYDADGIKNIRKHLPRYNAKDSNFPVLVFWKRQFIPEGLSVTGGSDDTFVYSLVAYYLVNDNNANWSNVARIERFQISGGYGETVAEIESTRDKGFEGFTKLFEEQGEIKEKMNKWQPKAGETYQQRPLALLDYIDQTPINNTSNPAPTCSQGSEQLIPKYTGSGDDAASGNVATRGFYVCVDAGNTVAEVNIRGNALSRLQKDNINFNKNNEMDVFFPEVSARVKGRGFVFTK